MRFSGRYERHYINDSVRFARMYSLIVAVRLHRLWVFTHLIGTFIVISFMQIIVAAIPLMTTSWAVDQ